MARLLFVRHGETEHNEAGQICTHTDGASLSALGLQQALKVAERLSTVAVSAVYSSPMARALQTAGPIAERHRLPVQVCHELRELSAGELDGRSDADAFTVLNAALDAWCNGDGSVRIGLTGDIGSDIISRLARVVEDLSRRHEDEIIVLVSHGGLLQIGIPWVCSNLTPAYGHRRHVDNTSIIEIDVLSYIHCIMWDCEFVSESTSSIFK